MEQNKRKFQNAKSDTDYFMSIVKKSGLTYRQFAESIGRSKSFVYNAMTRGYSQIPALKLMCKIYRADYNKMVIQDAVEEEPKAEHKMLPYADAESVEKLLGAILRIEKKLDKLSDMWE